MRVALDTNVALYAVGDESPHREPCREIVRGLSAGAFNAEASVELVQEYLHVRARRTGDRATASAEAAAWLDLVVCHPVERADVARAAELFQRYRSLDALDALHAATCLNREIPVIISVDRGFDAVDGLERIDPAEALPRLL